MYYNDKIMLKKDYQESGMERTVYTHMLKKLRKGTSVFISILGKNFSKEICVFVH